MSSGTISFLQLIHISLECNNSWNYTVPVSHRILYIFQVWPCVFCIYYVPIGKGENKKKKMFYTLGIVHSTHLLSWIACGKRQPSRRSTNRENPGIQTTKTFRCVFFFFYRFLSDRIYKSLYDWTAAVPVRDDSNVVAVVWITNQGKIHFHCVDVNWQSMPLVSDKFFFLLFLHNQQNFKIYIYFFFFFSRFLFVKRKWT